ncbi:MAG: winged helix-turn-helix transcriptional regulator [Glaciimonas sp.]|nr:winged helix-turn-helix transcriptional regulator [Glaciimonas sp.]
MSDSTNDIPPLFHIDTYQIEDSIGYLLAHTCTSSDEQLSKFSITYAQAAILLMLSNGKYSTAADLAREIYTDAASIKRMIDRLEVCGLVSRELCPLDRRLVKLELTEEGAALAKLVPHSFCAVLNQHFEGFTPEEIGFLRSLLPRALGHHTQTPVIKTH